MGISINKFSHKANPNDHSAADESSIYPNNSTLIVLLPDDTVRRIPLNKKQTLIAGRSRTSDIHLAGAQVSRRHAQIEFDGCRLTVTDLGSTHGIFLNNVKLLRETPQHWTPDETLRIGPYQFNIVVPDLPQTDAAVTLEPRDMTVKAGQSAVAQISIQNRGRQLTHFQVAVEGVPTGWVSPLPLVELYENENHKVELVIKPPRLPSSRAMTWPLTIKVSDSSSKVTEVEGALTIAPYYEFSPNLRPQRQSGATHGFFEVQINNHGNFDLTVQLEAQDPDDACRYIFAPPQVTIQPGQERTVALTVQPKRAQRRKNAKTYFFTITVQPVDMLELTCRVQGQWEQNPQTCWSILRSACGCGTVLLTILIVTAISLFTWTF